MPIGQDNRQGLTANMKAQWTIATNLQRILNTYAVEWGSDRQQGGNPPGERSG